jgi:mRNA-degrading endonuclease RelE of RelBE toxin-antitoxin system
MKVIVPASVVAAIKTLGAEESRKVLSWLDHLQDWENDAHLRGSSKAMSYENTYVLNTSDDMRIFFTLDVKKKTITIVDISKPSRFHTAEAQSE